MRYGYGTSSLGLSLWGVMVIHGQESLLSMSYVRTLRRKNDTREAKIGPWLLLCVLLFSCMCCLVKIGPPLLSTAAPKHWTNITCCIISIKHVYIYIYIYIHTYIHIHIHIHYMYIYIYICNALSLSIYVYLYIYTYI